jgi:hypothetical protein
LRIVVSFSHQTLRLKSGSGEYPMLALVLIMVALALYCATR